MPGPQSSREERGAEHRVILGPDKVSDQRQPCPQHPRGRIPAGPDILIL